MSSRFGPLPILNLIIAMRELNLPIEALDLEYFPYLDQQEWVKAAYAASLIELVDEARKLEGKP